MMVLFLSGLLFSTAALAADKEVKLQVEPTRIGQGQMLRLQISGKDISGVQSVQFNPSDGVTVGEISEDDQALAGVKIWLAAVTAGPGASLGKRSVAVTTPEGTARKNFEIVAQPVPVISDLKVEPGGKGYGFSRIVFRLAVEHAPAALPNKPELAVGLAPSRPSRLALFKSPIYYAVKAKSVEPVDERHSIVHVDWVPSGQVMGSDFNLSVFLKDKFKSWSNRLDGRLTF